MVKSFMTLIIALLVVIVVAWIGISIFDATNDSEVNPNAEQYIGQISPQFDLEVVDSITSRIVTLPISTQVFHNLEINLNGGNVSDNSDDEDDAVVDEAPVNTGSNNNTGSDDPINSGGTEEL